MKVAIIKYNAGNTRSVEHALHRLGIQPIITDNTEEIVTADKVIFPGVGHAETTMQFLKNKNLDKLIKELNQPVLGICLGQQLMCAHSEEGNVDCLNIFPIQVKKFSQFPSPKGEELGMRHKIPQIGWNNLFELKSKLFNNISEQSFVYFVHSFYCELSNYNIATCDYILPFSSALQRDNFYAVQFHPEKSASVGEKIIENFLEMC